MGLKLWRVYNGWMGEGPIHVLVIAPTKERAEELAGRQFKIEVDEDLERRRLRAKAAQERWGLELKVEPNYPESYWANVRAELLCDNLTAEWAGKVDD